MGKPILCLDFDGVCHLYTSGWKGAAVIPDQPVDGMYEFLRDAAVPFSIHIFSSRSHQEGGIEAMRTWFYKHLPSDDFLPVVEQLQFPLEKPPAFLGLDDSVLNFRGSWPDVEELQAFKTWTQQPLGATGTHPRGKVTEHDEGELRMAVYQKDGTVFVDFGKTTAWIGLDVRSARNLAALLCKYADSIG